MKHLVPIAAAAIAVTTGADAADLLWDNGPPNGENGYSNATEGVFGARRTVLDDFVVDHFFAIQSVRWEHIWNTRPPGSGAGVEFSVRSDLGGEPGPVIATPEIFSYWETSTGVTYFGRAGAESWVRLWEPVTLLEGTYWIEATIVGLENNFWLTTEVRGNPCWIDYDDLGGLQPGRDLFDEDADLNFVLEGSLPAAGALPLLGAAGLFGARRRRNP
jgi:MYXO-CTERM domain-containing protein